MGNRWWAYVVVLSLTLLSGIAAKADDYAYEGDGNANFGVIDLTTGKFTKCGYMAVQLSGLGVGSDGKIYGGAFIGDTFYRVNPKNGALTTIAHSNVTFWDTGSSTTGLYAVGMDSKLYKINITNGHGTLIGPTGVPVLRDDTWYGMSTNSASLFYSHEGTLFQLSVVSGKATKIGTTKKGVFGAEVFEGSKLYAGSENPLSVFTLSTSNGAASLVSNVTGASGNFWGLVPIAATKLAPSNICASHPIGTR